MALRYSRWVPRNILRSDSPTDGYRRAVPARIVRVGAHATLAHGHSSPNLQHDLAKRVEFDVSRWFATAPVEKILNLALNAWHSASLAHDLAADSPSSNDGVADVFQYVRYLRHGRLRCGYRCSINSAAALKWLAAFRPCVAAALGSHGGGRSEGRRKSAKSGKPKINTNGTKKTRPCESA